MVLINRLKKQNGAVSLFIVIFVALLVVVTMISFMRLMVNNQQQAMESDLSRSAYDSAQAGVEDVKRALILYKAKCSSTAPADVLKCSEMNAILNPSPPSTQKCNQLVSKLGDYSALDYSKGIKVNSGDSNDQYDQAYTCTLVNMNTDDYLGSLSTDQSVIIPLIGVNPVSQVKIEWFSKKDLSSGSNAVSLMNAAVDATPLIQKSAWPTNRPPILRAQYIQFSTSGTLANNFDSGAYTNTAFLYPTSGSNSVSFGTRLTATQKPSTVQCASSLGGSASSSIYACSTTISLPSLASKVSYLRLTSIYNKTNFRISLVGTKFKGVQPEVDSTGRSNSLYRRVKSRVEFSESNYPFPEAAVDINGNLCKSFVITDDSGDYSDGGCTP